MSVESVLILVKAKLCAVLPFDFEWIEVLAEQITEFRTNFSWQRLGRKVANLLVSLLVLYICWDLFAAFRQMTYQLAILLAKLDLEIFLVLLPVYLFFHSFEAVSRFVRFIKKPSKKTFRGFWKIGWVCALLWGVYFVNDYYSDQIQAFVDSL